MDPVTALLAGLLQGIFEWLPVSSEGVITLFLTQIGGQGAIRSVNIAIWLHLGTMLAALIYFRQDFSSIIKQVPVYLRQAVKGQLFTDKNASLTSFILLATLITAALGGAIYVSIAIYLANYPRLFTLLMALALLATGFLRYYRPTASKREGEIGLIDATSLGLFQALSVIPGVSRSGITVFGLFLRDFDAKSAFKLSFLLSVPAVLIANIGLGFLSGWQFSVELLLAGLVSFVVGYLTISLLLEVADRLEVAYLCFILAALALLSSLL